ncbi:MAG: hypothetical protein COA78_30350 [Blastopirellula sp.]|nr:MAG: hypothetical protein COA78_30350 [Blastopirellula sp.]
MYLNEDELDALAEVINIGSGRAASSLSEITGSRIMLTIPQIQVCDSLNFRDLANSLDLEFGTTVQQGFSGKVSGRALLAFPKDNAVDLARLVGEIETSTTEMDEELCGVLEEIGNIVLNSILGTIANMIDCGLSYTLPQLCTKNSFTKLVLENRDHIINSDSVILVADTSITVADRDISGSLLLLFETGDIKTLLSSLINAPIV